MKMPSPWPDEIYEGHLQERKDFCRHHHHERKNLGSKIKIFSEQVFFAAKTNEKFVSNNSYNMMMV